MCILVPWLKNKKLAVCLTQFMLSINMKLEFIPLIDITISINKLVIPRHFSFHWTISINNVVVIHLLFLSDGDTAGKG